MKVKLLDKGGYTDSLGFIVGGIYSADDRGGYYYLIAPTSGKKWPFRLKDVEVVEEDPEPSTIAIPETPKKIAPRSIPIEFIRKKVLARVSKAIKELTPILEETDPAAIQLKVLREVYLDITALELHEEV